MGPQKSLFLGLDVFAPFLFVFFLFSIGPGCFRVLRWSWSSGSVQRGHDPRVALPDSVGTPRRRLRRLGLRQRELPAAPALQQVPGAQGVGWPSDTHRPIGVLFGWSKNRWRFLVYLVVQ